MCLAPQTKRVQDGLEQLGGVGGGAYPGALLFLTLQYL